MKKILTTVAASLLTLSLVYAQPSANPEPAGQVTLADNTQITGVIKDNIRKKGEISLEVNGKKIKYKASEINSAQIGGSRYITSNYTFYEVISEGKNFTLLRKASEPSGIQYNGSDAVVVSSQGDIDDFLIKKKDGSLHLLTKKNAKEVLGQFCPGVVVEVSQWDATTVKKLVEDCNK